MVFPKPPQELHTQATALTHTEKLLRAEGIPAPSRQLCLGKLVVPFGQYENAPFHWLLANDVGYVKYVVDKHRSEVTKPHRRGMLNQFRAQQQFETLFQPWVDNGMVIRLDIFHWIHWFDAALRTESHSKYHVFKSALAGAVPAYNRTDLELLIKAVRAKDPASLRSRSDEEVVRHYIFREQLKHHVQRVTLGAQETFRLIHLAIEELKGPAGLDENGASLFKTSGPCCTVGTYQVYLIGGIALWNSDRSSGGKRQHHRTYSAPLIYRLNTCCRQLFGETVEENFRAPADVPSNELPGLEYLFSQSTGESGPFSLQDIVIDGPGPEEEVVQPGQPDPDPEAEDTYQSDVEGDDVLHAVLPHITLTSKETAVVHPLAFEDACSPNPLPRFQKVEMFCSVLAESGLTEDKLSLTTEQGTRCWKFGMLWRSTTSSHNSFTS